jgi:hypothetical protein
MFIDGLLGGIMLLVFLLLSNLWIPLLNRMDDNGAFLDMQIMVTIRSSIFGFWWMVATEEGRRYFAMLLQAAGGVM